MATTTMTALLPKDIKTVWDIVTSLTAYAWRSDLQRIEVQNKTQFIEYTKDGFSTAFTITYTMPYARLELDMENENIKGHWVGIFSEKKGQTQIVFTENVSAKKIWIKPFVKSYLKKQQTQYISDLKKALS